MQRMESVPTDITDSVLKLCKSICANSPVYIPVAPENGATINECFENVENVVKQRGGTSISGWAIWQMANILVEAEAHSVWKSDNGELVDVTPHADGESKILFLPDDNVKYNGENIGNIRMALTKSPLVKEYIELHEEVFEILKMFKPHEKFLLSDLPERYYEIQQRLIEIEVQFHTKAGRNDKCPCGSGLKYKKCCGK